LIDARIQNAADAGERLQRLDLARALGAVPARNFRIPAFSLKKGHYYFFDPKHNVAPRLRDADDYEPHSKRHQDLAKLAIALSAAAIAFKVCHGQRIRLSVRSVHGHADSIRAEGCAC